MRISEQKLWVNIGIISLSRRDAEKEVTHMMKLLKFPAPKLTLAVFRFRAL